MQLVRDAYHNMEVIVNESIIILIILVIWPISNLSITCTGTDWAFRSQGGRMERGRETSQYAVMDAKAPSPMREDGERDREEREKGEGRRLRISSTSAFPNPPLLGRRERNHSCNCIAERKKKTEKNELFYTYKKLHTKELWLSTETNPTLHGCCL